MAEEDSAKDDLDLSYSAKSTTELVGRFKQLRVKDIEHLADGELIYELNSPEENAIFEDFLSKHGDHEVFKARNGDRFWPLACLRARKYDIDRALEVMQNYFEWRKEFKIDDLTYDGDVGFQERVNHLVVRSAGNKDKLGRYIITLQLRRKQEETSPRQAIQIIHSVLEYTLRTFPESQARGIVLVGDQTDVHFSQLDTRIPRELFAAFSNKLPLRFGGIFIVNPPFFFKLVFPVIKMFMKRKLKERLKIINGYEGLLEHIDQDQLLVDLDGTFEYDHDVFIEKLRIILGDVKEQETCHNTSDPTSVSSEPLEDIV